MATASWKELNTIIKNGDIDKITRIESSLKSTNFSRQYLDKTITDKPVLPD